MKVLKCDILIVGAGVAGSVAALTASKYGLNTILVEEQKQVGHGIYTKLDLTESIGIEQIIKELDLPVHAKSNKSKWFSPNHILNYKSEIYDLYIKRGGDDDSFEKKNISRILDNGGRVLTNTHLKEFKLRKNSFIKKLTLKNDNDTIEIEPKFIIGADGVNSKILRLSGLSKYEHIFGEFHAIGIYGKDFDLPARVTHIFFDKNIAPGGYIFAAKTENNECVLGVGFDPSMTNKSPKEHFEKAKSNKLISKILKDAKILNHFSGFGKYGFLQRHSIGNLMLAGDAGRFGDPFLCYGVRPAILSGYNATNTCKTLLESTSDLSQSMKYESSMMDLQNAIKIGLFLRKVYKKLNNKDIDVIVKILSDAQEDGLDLDRLFRCNNNILIKHLLKNMGGCSHIVLRALPNVAEYFFKIRNM
jgi:digeranylgeranylglycerophospholipid reductase